MRSLKAFLAAFLLLMMSAAFAADALPPSGAISPEKAMSLLKSKNRPAVVDVRTPAEYAEGHIKDARLVPLQTLESNLDKIPDGPVILLCRAGVRAERAWETIRKAQPERKNLWFLKGSPVYHPDGSFEFR